MAAEERLRSKLIYKIQLYLLKVIPMVMAFFCWLNTTLSYFDIDLVVLTYIGGCTLITLVYLYISSYVFRFCEYHRMFLHYVTVIWILNLYDYYIGIPVNNLILFIIYQILAGIALFVILYLYVKVNKKPTGKAS